MPGGGIEKEQAQSLAGRPISRTVALEGQKRLGPANHGPQSLQIVSTQTGLTTGGQNSGQRPGSQARDPEELGSRGLVDIDGEGLGMTKSPGGFGIDVFVEIGVCLIDQFLR